MMAERFDPYQNIIGVNWAETLLLFDARYQINSPSEGPGDPTIQVNGLSPMSFGGTYPVLLSQLKDNNQFSFFDGETVPGNSGGRGWILEPEFPDEVIITYSGSGGEQAQFLSEISIEVWTGSSINNDEEFITANDLIYGRGARIEVAEIGSSGSASGTVTATITKSPSGFYKIEYTFAPTEHFTIPWVQGSEYGTVEE